MLCKTTESKLKNVMTYVTNIVALTSAPKSRRIFAISYCLDPAAECNGVLLFWGIRSCTVAHW
jgi:hypothetical protein